MKGGGRSDSRTAPPPAPAAVPKASTVDSVRGMDIIFVTSAKTDDEARELLRRFSFPFEK